jgi:predicted SprT family Zn-dependent metalloprotease
MRSPPLHPHDAAQLARSLMAQHGLSGWSFRFDHARRRFGSCRYRERVITLSRPLVLLNDVAEVRDTILHEIAHALSPGDGHGPKWRAACRQIGARPVRCYSDQTVRSPARPPARYRLGCGHCDWWVDRHRLTRTRYVCRRCSGPLIYRELIPG